MKHRFFLKNYCYDPAVFNDCQTLSKFIKLVDKQSGLHPERIEEMTYRGDAFEALVEAIVVLSPIDKRINIVDYVPWAEFDKNGDYGIDGIGKSHNGLPHCVQVKFRSDAGSYLTTKEDGISNFVAKTLCMHYAQEVDMTVITTAKGLAANIGDKMYHDRVRVLGYDAVCSFVDDNVIFWNKFREAFEA